MGKSVSRCITVTTVINGTNGTNGYNTAVVQLFRRYTPTQGAPIPALPNGALTYTFSTGKLTGSYFNGWSQDMPSAASGGKLFITMATARSTEATDSIAANEWATPVEYITDGPKGEPGISQAPVIIYKRSATQPADKPADGAKYYFKTVGSGSSKIEAGSLVGTLSGWSTVIPDNTNGLPCWTRQATAVAPATADYDEIAASEWSDPATKLVEDGVSITSADIVFCLSDDGTTEPADSSSWATTFADLITSTSASKYVWQATKMELSNSSTPRYTGKQCLGKVSDFASVTEQFALGTASAVTGSWQDNTPPPPSKGSYLWTRTKLTFKDNHSTYTTPQCVGYYAKDNVEYKISLAGSVLAHDPNTGKLIVSIKGRVNKVEGDTTTTYTALTKDNLRLYFENASGNSYQVPEEDISVSNGQFATTYKNGANYNNEVLLGVRFNINNAIKARESIQVVKYGTNGQSITGHTGRFFYYAGEYNGVPGSYAMQETQGPYVKVTNGTAVEFWMLDFKGVEPASFPFPATQAPSDETTQTQWTKMSSQQQYYIARAFFGPYANLGSFIINNDWMISQFGVLYDAIDGAHAIDSDTASWNGYNKDNAYTKFLPDYPNSSQHGAINFCPNFAVDGKTGKSYQNDAYVNGTIVSGGTGKSRWEISPDLYGEIQIPTITGYDTLNNPKIKIVYDGDASDLAHVAHGGGIAFIDKEDNKDTAVGGYYKTFWEIRYNSGQSTVHSSSYIQAEPSAAPKIAFGCVVDEKSSDSHFGTDKEGIYIYSNKWPTSTTFDTIGRVYKDDWGYLKVKDDNSYDKINVKTSDFELPDDPPIGTMFFVKRVLNDITIKTGDAYVLNGSNNGTLWDPDSEHPKDTEHIWSDTHSMVLFYLGKIEGYKYWTMIYSS